MEYICVSTELLEPTPDWYDRVKTPITEFEKNGFTIINTDEEE